MRELFNLKIGLGSVSALQRRVSEHLAEPVAQALVFVRQQSSLVELMKRAGRKIADLTGSGLTAPRKSRSFKSKAGVVKPPLKQSSTRKNPALSRPTVIRVTVFCKAGDGKFALAHLKRDFTAMIEREDAESKEIGEKLLAETKKVFGLFAKVRDGTLMHCRLRRQIKPVKTRVKELLANGGTAAKAKTARVCRSILKLNRSLWTFVRVAEVEANNNRAERALRRAVLWRRKSFGTQSETGSRFVERILTVITTLGQQRRSVLAYLKTACATRTAEQNFVGLYLQAT